MAYGFGEVASNIIFVIKKPKYALLTIFLSFLLFSIFMFLNNISLFVSAFEISQDPGIMTKVLLNAADMVFDIGGIAAFGSVVTVSVLGGLSISMVIYKIAATRRLGVKQGLLSFGGVFGGALSSACAACSTALISILGVVGGLAIFPFRGLELSTLSIFILVVSIFFMSKNLNDGGVCKISMG